MFANAIGDILKRFGGCRVFVLGDATYGACCVDDFTARALGAEFLVHYGHSCLVPAPITTLPMLYVFVDIAFDPAHLVACLKAESERHPRRAGKRVALLATVQFLSGLRAAARALPAENYVVPQCAPLSGGEVLGCTSPKLDDDVDSLVFVADGRFHLEAAMIRNPKVPAFRYDPYAKKLTREAYDFPEMTRRRRDAIATARRAATVGVVLGTLGRQGSPRVLDRLTRLLAESRRKSLVVLASELDAALLEAFSQVDAWVQIACPRLSIDWGHHFCSKPLLSPYEAFQAFGGEDGAAATNDDWDYPMDFYSKAGGPWSNYYREEEEGKAAPPPAAQKAD